MNPSSSLSTFKSILEADWCYMNNHHNNNNTVVNPSHHDYQTLQNHQEFKKLDMNFCSNPSISDNNHLLLQNLIDSSSSCSPSQFNLDPSQTTCLSSLFNLFCSNSLDSGLDLSGFDANLLANNSISPALMGFNGMNMYQMGANPQLSSNSEFPATRLLPIQDTHIKNPLVFRDKYHICKSQHLGPNIGEAGTGFNVSIWSESLELVMIAGEDLVLQEIVRFRAEGGDGRVGIGGSEVRWRV